MDINFNSIKKDITKRETEIKTLRQQIAALLIVDPELQVILDPAAKSDAQAVMQRINLLKEQNARDVAFRNHALGLLQKHSIPLTETAFDGSIGLGTLVSNLENQIYYGIQNLKKRFLAGELTSAEYEAEVAAMRKPLQERIAEIESVNADLEKFGGVR